MAVAQFATLADQTLVVVVREAVGRLPGKRRIAKIYGAGRAFRLRSANGVLRGWDETRAGIQERCGVRHSRRSHGQAKVFQKFAP